MRKLKTHFTFCIKKVRCSKKIEYKGWKTKWIIPYIFILFFSLPSKAQETGPLLMKQELGYTLGGSVLGAGLGVIVWFMDPLNPSVTLKSTVQNGFVAGTALGALFGFYMLQNAIVIPQDKTLPDNLDQLLGAEENYVPIKKSNKYEEEITARKYFKLTIFNYRF